MRSLTPSGMKNANRRLIFETFRNYKQLTRVQLAELTNLSLPSVSKLVSELVEIGVLYPIGEMSNGLGRKPLRLGFNAGAIRAFGVEFEGHNLTVGLVGLDGVIFDQISLKTTARLDEDCFDRISACIESMMPENTECTIAGIGLGVPAVVNPEEGRLSFASLVGIPRGLDVTPLIKRLTDKTGLTVWIDNDVNVAAMGELLVRSPGTQDLLYVSLGTGVGAGIVLNGELRRGAHWQCGELGYHLGGSESEICRESNGWLEERINWESLVRRFGPNMDALEMRRDIAHYVSSMLSLALANLINVLDFEILVLGGAVTAMLGDPFFEVLYDDLKRLLLSDIRIERCISPSPGVIGAASVVIEQSLENII